MKVAGPALLVLSALSLAGCRVPLAGLSVEATGVAQRRPAGTIGPPGSEGPAPWLTYRVAFPSLYGRTLASLDSTFHLRVTNCAPEGGWIATEDVYVDGVTLNGSHTGHARPRENRGAPVSGIAYVSVADTKGAPELCFQARGGSTLGLGFRSNVVRVKQRG
jgi:hypothetical protein